MNEKYKDILHYDYQGSRNHRKMLREDRAAQFAPFSALNGFSNYISEKNKVITEKIILTEEEKLRINDILLDLLVSNHLIKIVYYNNDTYLETINYVLKIDEIAKSITLNDNQKINFDDIFKIDYLD